MQQRFPERDGMYFLADEVATYDKKRLAARDVEQLEFFVSDEASAIQWLRQAPHEASAIIRTSTAFHERIGWGWPKHEKQMELLELLEYNFLCYTGDGDIPSHIHAYLSTNFKELRGLKKDDARLIAKEKGDGMFPTRKRRRIWRSFVTRFW